jgi:N-acetylglucosaminyldiphosphoundecaprenol N-acetyl-beta-D-mannosaminyltransferase
MGVVWGARWLGYNVPERVAGVDLFEKLLKSASDREFPVFLLGGTEAVIEATFENVKKRFSNLKIAGYHHGYFWESESALVEKIRKSGARLLFVAISSPKKEQFINRWRNELGVDFAMGVGGTFDIVSGKTRRAPSWMQNNGLEWFYRVMQEPGRMWRRYFVTNIVFAFMLLRESGGGRRG